MGNEEKRTEREMFVSLDPEPLGQRGIIYRGLFKLGLLHRSLQPRCQLTLNMTVAFVTWTAGHSKIHNDHLLI